MTRAEKAVKVFDRADGAKVVYVPSKPSLAVCRAQRRKSAALRSEGFSTALAIGQRELNRTMAGEW